VAAIRSGPIRPVATGSRRTCSACPVHHVYSQARRPITASLLPAVQRLFEPLGDALAVFGIHADLRTRAVQVLFREMAARSTAYWAWTEPEWYEILQPTFRVFSGRYPDRADQTVRQQLVAVAYLVGPLTNLSSTLLRSVSPVALARRLFAGETLEAALRRVLPVIESWGYASIHQREDLTAALAEALPEPSPGGSQRRGAGPTRQTDARAPAAQPGAPFPRSGAPWLD
jgi:hypothetical protein